MAFSLQAVFGVDATGVKTGLKEARGEISGFAGEMVKLFAFEKAFEMFQELGKGALELASHLSATAKNIGVNVESLQALYAAAAHTGVGQEQLDKALEKVKSAVIEAAQGNKKYADALAVLHLNGARLIELPLDKQYAAIARATVGAADQAEAFRAVVEILGEKVAPKLMASLKELGTEGLGEVVKRAREAGEVMSAETIVGLERANIAIEDFKKKATVAVGDIMINFRSEDGLKLLGLKLLKVAGEFGGMLLDYFTEAGSMAYAVLKGAFKGSINVLRDGYIEVLEFIAKKLNEVLPQKFQINIGNLDQFKSDGKGVADSITEAIAQTSPSTFKKDFGEFWGQAVKDQQKVVDAITRIDLKPEADKLRDAGKAVKTNLGEGAKAVAAAGAPLAEAVSKSFVEWKNVADTFKNCADEFMTAGRSFSEAAVKISRHGLGYEEQSSTALAGVIERLQIQFQTAALDQSASSVNSPGGHTAEYYAFQSELYNAQKEMSMRQEVAQYAGMYGQEAAVRQYGDTLVQRAQADITAAQEKTNSLLVNINHNLNALVNG